MGGTPDWNPATFAAKPGEIVLKPVALLAPSAMTVEGAVLLDKHGAMRVETIHLLAGREYIRSKLGNVPDRPSQQRQYDRLGNTRRPVLTNVTIARDARRCASGPWLECQAARGKIIPQDMEVERDLQQVSDDDRTTGAIIPEMAGISVQKGLVDPVKINNAKFVAHEIEEAPCSVEYLPDTSGRKYLAVTRQIDVEPGVEEFAQCLADARILDRHEMHGDVTAAGVLTKHGRSKVPAWIAVAREGIPIKSRLQRSGCKNRALIELLGVGSWCRQSLHCRASGGR
ncbi:hypothetical protein N182_30580 [Sinorhizobium sp. GL2]|nr:hypothetical protein N182_30580 [Sinorhizobium sp. GL2]